MPEVVFPKSFQISNCRKRSTKRSGKLEFWPFLVFSHCHIYLFITCSFFAFR